MRKQSPSVLVRKRSCAYNVVPVQVNFLMYLEPFVGFLILANGILIGLQTDPTFEDWPHWVYVEMVFNFFLVLEVMLRLCSLNRLLGSCFQSSNSRAYGAAHQDCSRVLCAIGYPVVDMAEMDVGFRWLCQACPACRPRPSAITLSVLPHII
ncbi:unnamed protein product [Symbiodinium sp. KB8]|nr:unnamed protein product [Symbiodinium sp. KB8]